LPELEQRHVDGDDAHDHQRDDDALHREARVSVTA
jgi:hypothetical protein